MEHTNTELDATFNELESLTTDPLIDRIYKKASEFEEMVNTLDGVTEQDRLDLIAELDAMWPYHHEKIMVSGRASFQNNETEQIENRFFGDEVMVSNGFCFTRAGEKYLDGEVVEQYKVSHHLWLPLSDDGTTFSAGIGLLEDVAIEYPRQSLEMGENTLRYFHPALMEELDCIILNCDNEEDAVLGMNKFTLDIKISEFNDMQLITDLQNYIRNVLNFDSELPYTMTFSGDCFVCDDEGRVSLGLADDNVTGLVMAKSIQFIPQDTSLPHDQVQTLVPCLEVALYKPDKQSKPTKMYIPALSLNALSSVRRQVYEPID